MIKIKYLLSLCPFFIASTVLAQNLSLQEAVQEGQANYGSIKVKQLYVKAAERTSEQVKRDFWPNLTLAAQQDYGTINGQNGPLYSFGGLGVASSGMPLDKQNWNAAFGALYLVNMNWEFYSFGRIKQRIALAQSNTSQLQQDVEQEKFQQKIKIAAAYLNLLASHRIVISQQKNLDRSVVFYNIAAAKVKNGILPGVDSTLAAAEVAKAKISLFQAKENVKEQNNRLAYLMGGSIKDLSLDTTLMHALPKNMLIENNMFIAERNPILLYQKSKIALGEQQLKLAGKEALPTLSFFGVYQTRASGFNSDYMANNNSFTRNYWDGVNPSRQNYLLGLGVSWNLTSIARTNKKMRAQEYTNEGLRQEYNLLEQQFLSQLDAADMKIKLSYQSNLETPKQVNAAAQAYNQKLNMYQNGLTTLVDVTQTLYILNRAETDREIIHINLWQSMLLKAAVLGDFEIFSNEL